MKSIINALKSGSRLEPMQSAGSFFEDGFVLRYEKDGLQGFSEVMTSTVLDLEDRGLIWFNPRLWKYVLTKKGEGDE